MSARRGVRVRAAGPADLSLVVELRLALLREHGKSPLYARLRLDAPDRARRLFAAQLTSPTERIFLAEDERGVVGIIRCVESIGSPLVDPQRYGYVSSAYVRPEARRQGALRALVDAARGWCAERGLEEMRLHSVAGDPASNAAWDALGFTVVEQMRLAPVEARAPAPPAGRTPRTRS
ncbi:MAG: GNAT family N-acetyltransferase [Gemmatimonadaceae bacterium]|nr:GNAT family N-acetyltransferase [Gemmatimonadaceae bacterium]NUR20250.1 GNAT family N-acetyltransferase [Gemmatimonadaceae bacterium]